MYGKCSFPYCIRYKQKRIEDFRKADSMATLTEFISNKTTPDKSGFGFAVDIGTTTLAVYLYDIGAAKALSVKTAINPQSVCGLDVLSRISYCEKNDDGLNDLHGAVIKALDELFKEACDEARVSYSDIKYAVLSGNTVMLHIAAGLSPVSIGKYPFMPQSLFGIEYSGGELGFHNNVLKIYLSPCMTSFVGGDISSAILASTMMQRSETSLLMDLGTNGELALYDKGHLYVTSAPAGPAFEGSSIECGMASVNGAISEVLPLNGKIEIKTIGDVKPIGICGSGLIDAAALFVKAGIINKTGLISGCEDVIDTLRNYVVETDETCCIQLTDDVYISQKDIRELQNAKAAVAAGVECLLEKAGINSSDIAHIYLAGGFGNALKISSAVDIGLIAADCADKTVSIGNGSAAGAAMMLMNDECKREAESIAEKAEFVQIGGDDFFAKKFMENINFP